MANPLNRFAATIALATRSALMAYCFVIVLSESAAQVVTSTGEAESYTVTAAENFQPASLDLELPDLTRFSPENVRRMVPAQRDGKASVGLASDLPVLDEALHGDRGRDIQRRQAAEHPRVILIEDGALSLEQVVEQLSDERIAENQAGVVTLRLPLCIQPGAVLIVDGKRTPHWRLSTDQGAFVANAGRLFALDVVVTSWSEATAQPSVFVAKAQFRPFIASYIRSETYLAGSTIQHLGFAAPTAYGFSLSSHPERNQGEPKQDWPTGILVSNEFRGLYYGFYSFEARDVAIVDNLYIDNVVYGIDPHDRSTRLVIARNTATGTLQRHGIIGSRGITHSFIVDNVTAHNAGSGIMLDRQCARNIVAGNRVYQNGQGIAVYESAANTICDNLVAFNSKSGVRVRNSIDIQVQRNTVVGHGDYALEVYAKRLDDHEKRVARGDTYDTHVGVSFFGNRVQANRGLVKATNLGRLQLSNIRHDVDLPAIAAKLNVSSRMTPTGDDTVFGQELKPLASQLKRVIDDPSVMLEVKGRRWSARIPFSPNEITNRPRRPWSVVSEVEQASKKRDDKSTPPTLVGGEEG